MSYGCWSAATLNAGKFCFGETSVDYCGYKISSEGYTVDTRKVEAISSFPHHTTRFVHGAYQPARKLLFRHRLHLLQCPYVIFYNVWVWTPQHDKAFQKVKEVLASPPILAHFDASLPTKLETDASRMMGFGFVLRQRHGEEWKLIQCGSRFLTDTESRYAVTEMEIAALVWAVKKC